MTTIPPKVTAAMDAVRAMIAAGKLLPGEVAPSAPALSITTGTCLDYCLRALRLLAADGTLDAPASRGARPRVPGGDGPGPGERRLSAALAAARRDTGLSREQLAAKAGVSLTTVRNAETGRCGRMTPQSWARLDRAVGADCRLVRMHADWQAGRGGSPAARPDGTQTAARPPGSVR